MELGSDSRGLLSTTAAAVPLGRGRGGEDCPVGLDLRSLEIELPLVRTGAHGQPEERLEIDLDSLKRDSREST